MKTRYLLLMLGCMLCFVPGIAQPVMPSGFSSTTGTFQEITDGTAIVIPDSDKGTALTDKAFVSATESISEMTTTTGIPIGFDFLFNNTYMNRFVIDCYPQVILGKDNITIDPDRSAFLLTDNYEGKNNVIGIGVFSDLNAYDDTQIRYKLTGTAPNRVLIVQWKNLGISIDWGTNFEKIDAQIRLYETSNKAELIFRNWASSGTSNKWARVGIKGTGKDAHLRYSSSDDFTNTELNNNNQMGWKNTANIPDGLTYTFTAPAECVVPTAQPTALQLNPSSIGITGGFTATTSADHYLIVMTTTATLSQMPQNGVTYAKDDVLGNGTVISYTTETSFATPETLNGATTYYFHLFAANSYCSLGPKYNTSNPLTGSVKTKPEAPVSLTATDVSYNAITLSTQGNAAGNDVIILVTDKPLYSAYGDMTENGDFAVPSGTLNVGDELQITDEEGTRYGGKVLYKGPSKAGIKAEGLTDNTIWHFIAYSVVGEEYSSTFVRENTLTWGKVPFMVDFDDLPGDDIFGWVSDPAESFFNGVFRNNEGSTYRLCCYVGSASTAAPALNSVTTQYILLSETSNRLVVNLTFFVPGMWGSAGKPYNEWDVNDYFDVELSTDGTNFTQAYRINHENAPQFAYLEEYKNVYMKFPDEFLGKKVQMRFSWKVHTGCRLAIDNLRIEEVSACDYPIDITTVANSVVGSNANIKWTAQGQEEFWDIRYREVGVEEWTYINNVNVNPYLLTGLPTSSSAEVTVRARCSETETSPWSPVPYVFKTGLSLPYVQLFEGRTMPNGWNTATGTLATPTVFVPGNTEWNTYNGNLGHGYYTSDDWVLFPVFDFGDGSYNYRLKFELTVYPSSDDTEDVLYIVMSKDGGTTFNTSDVIGQIALSDPTINDMEAHTMSYLLSGATDYNRLAFYTGSNVQGSTVLISNLSITATCQPLAENGTVSNITEDAATVNWEGAADEWMVFYRKAGETTKNYQTQTANTVNLSDLDPATTYEVGITHSCGENDLAKALMVRFTTVAVAPCDLVENINVTTTVNSATISWTHTGIGFNVNYRRKGVETWSETKVTTATATVSNLTDNTEYEYRIQAICSEADGDISEWTDIATFKTLAVTCFPPTNIEITPTHNSAEVTWEGNAANYELNYRTGDGSWTVVETNNKSATLKELAAHTDYSLRIRSKCSQTDISAWSTVQTFKTLQIPDCVIPSNLDANDITINSAVLTWKGDNSNLSWNLRYRKSSATSWNNITELTAESYTVSDLEPNTLYIWTVRANCDEERQSSWAVQSEFATTEVSVSEPDNEPFSVFTSGQTINIINPDNILIDNVRIISLNGVVLNSRSINSTDGRITIPAPQEAGIYIIRVESEKTRKNYKVSVL